MAKRATEVVAGRQGPLTAPGPCLSPVRLLRCRRRLEQVQGAASLTQGQYRALWQGFHGSELARAQVPRMARHMASIMRLTASSRDDPAALLGQQAGDALNALVSAAMLAWLRVKGSGEGQRILVGAMRMASGKGG